MSTLASRGFEPRYQAYYEDNRDRRPRSFEEEVDRALRRMGDNIQEAFARQAEAINNMANLIVDLQQEVQYLREDQGEKELGLSA